MHDVAHRNRTNNAVEGWHFSLNKQIPSNLGVFALIDQLRKNLAQERLEFMQDQSGQQVARKRNDYKRYNQEIERVLTQLRQASITSLDAVAALSHYISKPITVSSRAYALPEGFPLNETIASTMPLNPSVTDTTTSTTTTVAPPIPTSMVSHSIMEQSYENNSTNAELSLPTSNSTMQPLFMIPEQLMQSAPNAGKVSLAKQ